MLCQLLEPPGYPAALERTVVLCDGLLVPLRPVCPADAAGLQALHARLSRQSIYQRFFTVMPRLPDDWAERLATVDYVQRLALVAEDGTGALIGVARYEPTEEPGVAEIALVVEDTWQGRGLGRELLHAILAAAAARGIERFRADVLADNRRMLRLLARHTAVERRAVAGGVATIYLRPAVPALGRGA